MIVLDFRKEKNTGNKGAPQRDVESPRKQLPRL
jgi:hypothetical protein